MKKWVTLAFLGMAFFFYMSSRQLFGLLVVPIQAETGLSDIQIGFIDTVMFWTLAVVVPFAGMLGDRFSRVHIIAASVFLWGLFTALTGMVGGFLGFLAMRSIAVTAVQSFYAPSAYALIADEHKATRSTALSCHQGAMYAGMFCSGALVAVLLERFGSWRGVYALFGVSTMVVGVLFFLVFCLKKDPAGETAATKGQRKNMIAGMKTFFSNPAAICAGAGFVALNFVANGYAAWAPKFIANKFSIGVGETAKGVMFYPNVAAVVAVLVAGCLTDVMVKRDRRFRLVLQIGALLLGVPMMVLFGLTGSMPFVWVALVVWGVARGFFQANSHASVFDVVPAENRASAVGFLNLMTCLIGSLAPLAIGFLSHHFGIRGLEVGFGAMGGVLLAAALMMLYSRMFLFEKWKVE